MYCNQTHSSTTCFLNFCISPIRKKFPTHMGQTRLGSSGLCTMVLSRLSTRLTCSCTSQAIVVIKPSMTSSLSLCLHLEGTCSLQLGVCCHWREPDPLVHAYLEQKGVVPGSHTQGTQLIRSAVMTSELTQMLSPLPIILSEIL